MARGSRARAQGMSPFKAGLIAIVLIAVLSYFGFTKANPFANPYEFKGAFQTASNLKPKAPVRIAGVDVGKVKKIEPVKEGSGAIVTMEVKKKGLPLHDDAELKIRPRVFLEGNSFVDVSPGSPSSPNLKDGGTIPATQTAAPVQLGDVLTALQSDTREDLKTFLYEFAVKGLGGSGARGFNQVFKYGKEAYRNSALANDATLGQEPTKDLHRVLRGQQRTFGALVRDENALKGLVTNFNVVAGAFASQDAALEASVPALRDTLRVAQPALKSLNDSLPELRAFAREALPGVRSSGPTIDRSLPFLRQARALVSPRELGGTAAELRRQIPSLVLFNRRAVPLSAQGRALSACTNDVLVPFINSRIPNPEEPGNTNQRVNAQAQRGLVGLSGESRLNDGNITWFHVSAVPPGTAVRPAPPPDGGSQPPPRRPDVPCETQEPPDLNAPVASITRPSGTGLPGIPAPPPGLPPLPTLPISPLSTRAGEQSTIRQLKRIDRIQREAAKKAGISLKGETDKKAGVRR
jgi:phospholipid/cholesterol/gamma-HCH transport system substrate-binding protein